MTPKASLAAPAVEGTDSGDVPPSVPAVDHLIGWLAVVAVAYLLAQVVRALA